MSDARPGPAPAYAIGIGAPGATDPFEGVVIMAPNLPGWRNINLRKALGARFGVPIFVGNDANLAGAVALHLDAAGQDRPLGDGVDFAVGSVQRRHDQRPAQQAVGIPDCGNRHVDLPANPIAASFRSVRSVRRSNVSGVCR